MLNDWFWKPVMIYWIIIKQLIVQKRNKRVRKSQFRVREKIRDLK